MGWRLTPLWGRVPNQDPAHSDQLHAALDADDEQQERDQRRDDRIREWASQERASRARLYGGPRSIDVAPQHCPIDLDTAA
jgi:hypothetical protein